MGQVLNVKGYPKRIVSLVPSQTELLFDLGLEERIVGVTRFCIHPADKVKGKVQIGGTKRFDIEKIKALQPDLIIGNKEENYEEGIAELQKDFPVWMSDIYTLQDAFGMMRELGRITGTESKAEEIIASIAFPKINSTKTAAYFIWRKPYMVAAGNSFINEMLSVFGVKNVFSDLQRYPEIDPEKLQALNPDFVFLSSEPYAFSEKHIDEFKHFCPNAEVVIVDGEMFSWYGSRLALAPAYFKKLQLQLGLL
ncbi:MAG: helical backbone metal receptor [Chitinophagales bacterium]